MEPPAVRTVGSRKPGQEASQPFAGAALFRRVPGRGPPVGHENTVLIEIFLAETGCHRHVQHMPKGRRFIGAALGFGKIMRDGCLGVEDPLANEHPGQKRRQ